MPKILIVEDELLIALDLRLLVEECEGMEVLSATTIAEALRRMAHGIDFAFLDINVLDGTTIELGRFMQARKLPFVFMSANDRNLLPGDLETIPWLSKPFSRRHVLTALRNGLQGNDSLARRCD